MKTAGRLLLWVSFLWGIFGPGPSPLVTAGEPGGNKGNNEVQPVIGEAPEVPEEPLPPIPQKTPFTYGGVLPPGLREEFTVKARNIERSLAREKWLGASDAFAALLKLWEEEWEVRVKEYETIGIEEFLLAWEEENPLEGWETLLEYMDSLTRQYPQWRSKCGWLLNANEHVIRKWIKRKQDFVSLIALISREPDEKRRLSRVTAWNKANWDNKYTTRADVLIRKLRFHIELKEGN